MVIVTGGKCNQFGGGPNIGMDGDRGSFVEVAIAPDPDMLHGPPLVNLLAPNDQGLPLPQSMYLVKKSKNTRNMMTATQ